MTISVVIPTCNRYDTIHRIIDSILKNSFLPAEIIVVDQSDNNNTNEIINKIDNKKVPIIYHQDDGKGAARARNIGWRLSNGDIISFVDDDAIVVQNWIKSIIDTFQSYNNKIGIVGGKIIAVYEDRNHEWEIPPQWSYLLPHYEQAGNIGTYLNRALPPATNYSILKELLIEMNGFNENLGPKSGSKVQIYGEDSDLTLRVMKKGYKVIYNPECVVYHPVPLERQNQEFLNKRLFSEGATDYYIELLSHDYSLFFKIGSLVKDTSKLICLKSSQKIEDKRIYLGCKNFLLGRIYMACKSMLFWVIH